MSTFTYWADGAWRRKPLPDYDSAPVQGPPAPTYICGMDLGQVGDHSALCVLEKHQPDPAAPATYLVRHLTRWQLKVAYPRIVEDVVGLFERPPLHPGVDLVLDFGNVGPAFRDMLREAKLGATLVPVTATGGDTVGAPEPGRLSVPKRDLIMSAVILLQQGRLRIAEGLTQARNLTSELIAFQSKITASGHDTYGAKAGAHDDEVSALALACWYGERPQRTGWVI